MTRMRIPKRAVLLSAGLLLVACGERPANPPPPTPAPSLAVVQASPPAQPALTPAEEKPPAPAPLVTAKPIDLIRLLTGVAQERRIPVLITAAREALAAGRLPDAIAAAHLATTEPGATAREHLLLARCLFENGQQSDAKRELVAAESGLDAVGDQTVFEEFSLLEAQLLAAFGNVGELARGLEAHAARSSGGHGLAAAATRIRHGYRIRLTLAGEKPCQLIALWSDREDLSVISLPGAEKPVLGSATADLLWDDEPPAGTLLVFAVDPGISTAATHAQKLPLLPVDLPSDEAQRRPWRRFLEALRANPPSGSAVVRLPPAAP